MKKKFGRNLKNTSLTRCVFYFSRLSRRRDGERERSIGIGLFWFSPRKNASLRWGETAETERHCLLTASLFRSRREVIEVWLFLMTSPTKRNKIASLVPIQWLCQILRGTFGREEKSRKTVFVCGHRTAIKELIYRPLNSLISDSLEAAFLFSITTRAHGGDETFPLPRPTGPTRKTLDEDLCEHKGL